MAAAAPQVRSLHCLIHVHCYVVLILFCTILCTLVLFLLVEIHLMLPMSHSHVCQVCIVKVTNKELDDSSFVSRTVSQSQRERNTVLVVCIYHHPAHTVVPLKMKHFLLGGLSL